MNKNSKILILGAGLSGLSIAWHLQRKGISYCILEKEPGVGGMCNSKRENGFTFDYGGHALHFKNPYSRNFVFSLLGGNLKEHKRSAWVYSCDKYIPYPFQGHFNLLPQEISSECADGLLELRGKTKNNPKNFYDWICCNFGKGIARHFMIPYNKKFWTVSPEEMSADCAQRFIPLCKSLKRRERCALGYNAKFWYPKKGGMRELPSALAKELKNIYNNHNVTEINLREKNVTINAKDKMGFDYLVSTIPLPELAHLIGRLPIQEEHRFKHLRWNSILNYNFGVDKSNAQKKHWVYFPQEEISFYRLGFAHNFSANSVPAGKQAISAEISYSPYKPINRKGILKRLKKDLVCAGMLNSVEQASFINFIDMPYGYPIHDLRTSRAKIGIFSFLRKNNVIPAGRYGSWKHMSMEDVILQSKKIVDNFANGY